jgi:hypothetical protein
MTPQALRHTVATAAYRAGKALRDAPPGFGDFQPSPGTRRPDQILAHMGDLFDWALALAQGRKDWRDSVPLAWGQEVLRFFRTLAAFDEYLASGAAVACKPEDLFQGPIADALAHTGQLCMLRRMYGYPVRGENYFQAEIVAGRVGIDQARPRREFR